MDLEGPSLDSAAADRLPTRQMLAERIEKHLEERRVSVGARRRIGVALPTDAEVKSILSAREAAARRAHVAALQADVERQGVTALRCYDVSLDENKPEVFQDAARLSDVQVRQDVVRPVNKLMAILALRLRFSSVLKTVAAARESKQAKLDGADSGLVGGLFPLPSMRSIPPLTTLLRELPLPDITHTIPVVCGAAEHASQRLFDVPHARPCHDPFVFRLRHFAPVRLPSFTLNIATQADREVQGNVAASPSSETADEVPTMDVPSPPASVAQHTTANGDVDAGKEAVMSVPSLARISSDARGARSLRGAQKSTAGATDAEVFTSVLPSHVRGGYTTGMMQPQSS